MSLEELNASIDKIVADVWMIEPEKLRLKTKMRYIVEPRQAAIWLRITIFGCKQKQVADYYGQTHPTIYHAIKTVPRITQTDRIFRDRLNLVMQKAELVKKIYFDGK